MALNQTWIIRHLQGSFRPSRKRWRFSHSLGGLGHYRATCAAPKSGAIHHVRLLYTAQAEGDEPIAKAVERIKTGECTIGHTQTLCSTGASAECKRSTMVGRGS